MGVLLMVPALGLFEVGLTFARSASLHSPPPTPPRPLTAASFTVAHRCTSGGPAPRQEFGLRADPVLCWRRRPHRALVRDRILSLLLASRPRLVWRTALNLPCYPMALSPLTARTLQARSTTRSWLALAGRPHCPTRPPSLECSSPRFRACLPPSPRCCARAPLRSGFALRLSSASSSAGAHTSALLSPSPLVSSTRPPPSRQDAPRLLPALPLGVGRRLAGPARRVRLCGRHRHPHRRRRRLPRDRAAPRAARGLRRLDFDLTGSAQPPHGSYRRRPSL